MKLLRSLFAALITFFIVGCRPQPVLSAGVPTVPLITANNPILDGIVNDAEWQGSFTFSAIAGPGEPRTTFYLRRDGVALWVAVRCEEMAGRKIMAQPRGPEGSLSLDDAVTVALGLDGDTERTVDVGGYEGAMAGKLGSMAHLYEFTVNAAGSTARRYNETALPTPRFEARVQHDGEGWQAEFRIPFVGMGLGNPAGREIYANFLRYRPPGILAWRGMNHWGNYVPFPVDRIRLAANGTEPASQPELQSPPPVAPASDVPGNHDAAQTSKQEAFVKSDAGLKFLDSAVPSPWTMPQLHQDAVKLAHVTIIFGGNGLPLSIRGSEGELLARPVELLGGLKGNKVAIRWQPRPTFKIVGNRVLVRGQGAFDGGTIQVRTEMDFDGFMTVQVHFTGSMNAIDKVQLSCPLRAECARYIARGNVQTVLPLDSGDYKANGGRFWLGAENAGLSFTSDLPFFHAAEHRDEITVKNEGAVRELVITPFDRSAQIAANPTLQFYLQPTPVRRRSGVTSDDYGLWFEDWSDYQGYPDLSKMDKVKKFSDQMRSEKKVPLLYFNQMLAENAPAFAEHRDELMNLPAKMWYKRAYDPGKDVPCYVCCVRGPYGDILLNGIQKLSKEGGIGGVYMDGTTVAWDCDNPLHPACNELRAPVWNSPGETRIRGTRNFLKRLRGIFTEQGKKFILIGHTGGDLDINTLGFVDYFWEGEQLVRYLPGYRIPQSQFAVGYSGGPWGYRTQFYDSGWLGTRGENWSLAYDLLFNADNQRGGARAFLKQFETSDAVFHPYWKDGQSLLVKSQTKKTSVSYYTAAKAAMLVATNFEFTPDEIELKAGQLAPDDNWVDILTKRVFTTKQGVLHLPLPGYQGVALRPASQVEKVSPSPDATASTTAVDLKNVPPEQWEVSESTGPASVTAGWLRLQSVPFAKAATASLKGTQFGNDIDLSFKLKAKNRISIDLGSVTVMHDSGWKVDAGPSGWNEGGIYQVELPQDREVELKIALHGNHLSVWMDGQSVIGDMQLALRPQQFGQVKIGTWAGDSLELKLVSLGTRGAARSPVMPAHPAQP